jgi:pantetheine-phosphate adenylyltransferase
MAILRMLYAGTFDPVTNGHLDVIKRAARLTDHLIVGVLKNSEKKCYFTLEDRIKMLSLATQGILNVEIDSFDGLLADYVVRNRIDAVVRGLRVTTDFDYELQMAQMNARLHKGSAETVFLMTDPAYSFVSSSLIKEVFMLGGEIEGFVPSEAYVYIMWRKGQQHG